MPAARTDLLRDSAWLREQYVEHRRSLRDIAAEMECSPARVRDALKRAEIDRRPPGTTQPIPELHDKAWLRSAQEVGLTQRQIADDLGCSVSAVGRALTRELGVGFAGQHPKLLASSTWTNKPGPPRGVKKAPTEFKIMEESLRPVVARAREAGVTDLEMKRAMRLPEGDPVDRILALIADQV